MNLITPNNVDAYIANFSLDTQIKLAEFREIIRKAAPEATEVISYKMPAYKFHGMLVYFGGYQNHIGFYPTGSVIAAFKNKISTFKTSKGTIQFPLDKPLPIPLIEEIVKFRVSENLAKLDQKKK